MYIHKYTHMFRIGLHMSRKEMMAKKAMTAPTTENIPEKAFATGRPPPASVQMQTSTARAVRVHQKCHTAHVARL